MIHERIRSAFMVKADFRRERAVGKIHKRKVCYILICMFTYNLPSKI
ncbi:unnamed protein product [Arabidopsis halleri]